MGGNVSVERPLPNGFVYLYRRLTSVASSDPWWIYTTCNLFWVVKTHYNFGIIGLVRECPRFGLMLGSMCLSIVFIVADVLSVTEALSAAIPLGINPFWKVSSPTGNIQTTL